jgi:hypothetical protein
MQETYVLRYIDIHNTRPHLTSSYFSPRLLSTPSRILTAEVSSQCLP